MKNRTWTDAQLTTAFKQSTSIRQILIRLGLREAGGNYSTVSTNLQRLGLDQTRLTGKGWSRNRKLGPRKTIEEICVRESSTHRGELKKRLLEEGLIINQCMLCGLLPRWQDKELIMHLDHINGIRNDHRLENLRMLCPNCHSQTATYCGKNIRRE
jgi:5-methylcytosine-specific restriction endonuclease McrA